MESKRFSVFRCVRIAWNSSDTSNVHLKNKHSANHMRQQNPQNTNDTCRFMSSPRLHPALPLAVSCIVAVWQVVGRCGIWALDVFAVMVLAQRGYEFHALPGVHKLLDRRSSRLETVVVLPAKALAHLLQILNRPMAGNPANSESRPRWSSVAGERVVGATVHFNYFFSFWQRSAP